MVDQFPLVSTDWLARNLNNPDIVVLDASVYLNRNANGEVGGEFRSGLDRFEKKDRIPGARFADLFTEFSNPEAEFPFTRPREDQFEAAVGRLGIGPQTHVVIYDNLANQWAARLWWVFRSFGHSRTSVLDGGSRKYVREGHPLEHEITPFARTNYTIATPRQIVATKKDILDIVRGKRPAQLICFLLPDDYAGTTSVRSRPGHIPGSVNLPFTSLVDPTTNALKTHDELISEFSAVASLDGDLIVTYCGGGIASALGALALAVIEYDNTLEYDNSLSEWVADDELPLEIGC